MYDTRAETQPHSTKGRRTLGQWGISVSFLFLSRVYAAKEQAHLHDELPTPYPKYQLRHHHLHTIVRRAPTCVPGPLVGHWLDVASGSYHALTDIEHGRPRVHRECATTVSVDVVHRCACEFDGHVYHIACCGVFGGGTPAVHMLPLPLLVWQAPVTRAWMRQLSHYTVASTAGNLG